MPNLYFSAELTAKLLAGKAVERGHYVYRGFPCYPKPGTPIPTVFTPGDHTLIQRAIIHQPIGSQVTEYGEFYTIGFFDRLEGLYLTEHGMLELLKGARFRTEKVRALLDRLEAASNYRANGGDAQ